jgi:citrate lyase synthetase
MPYFSRDLKNQQKKFILDDQVFRHELRNGYEITSRFVVTTGSTCGYSHSTPIGVGISSD